MPKIMQLEGPAQLSRAVTPSLFMRTYQSLEGIFDPVRMHKGVAIVGLLLGVWLAGTSPGRSVTTKARSLIRRKR